MRGDIKEISEIILSSIKNKARIIDLGCGEGSLIKLLQRKNINVVGIDIDNKKIEKCIHQGLSVINYNINDGFLDYKDKSFDYVILNQTLQVVKNPVKILNEAVRIGKTVVVGFPNFAYYSIRFSLLLKGKMPVSKTLPYQWYDTPNIHLFTIKDFINICCKNKIKIIKKVYPKIKILSSIWPNLLSEQAIFLVEKK
jgi:methionine biosynthesis protein MetW